MSRTTRAAAHRQPYQREAAWARRDWYRRLRRVMRAITARDPEQVYPRLRGTQGWLTW